MCVTSDELGIILGHRHRLLVYVQCRYREAARTVVSEIRWRLLSSACTREGGQNDGITMFSALAPGKGKGGHQTASPQLPIITGTHD